MKDESAAYLEFLTEEVCHSLPGRFRFGRANGSQAQKFGNADDDEDEVLGEENLLDSPLDPIEPYGTFKNAIISESLPQCLSISFFFPATCHTSKQC